MAVAEPIAAEALLAAVLEGRAEPRELSELPADHSDGPLFAGAVAGAAVALPQDVDRPAVWRGLCDALAHTGHPVASPVLTALLNNDDENVRRAAGRALLGMGISVPLEHEPVRVVPEAGMAAPARHGLRGLFRR